MEPRRRDITLGNGVEIKTPLAIPSLSTRNVGRLDYREPNAAQPTISSYASIFLREYSTQFVESLLVSAFDLHRHSLHDSARLLTGEDLTVFHTPGLLMIDSGMYETRRRVGYDDGYEEDVEWEPETYREVLSSLPATLRPAIVNYDLDAEEAGTPHCMPYAGQIQSGRELFASHRDAGFASVMLLKPERRDGFLRVADLTPHVADLREFDIIAITEKELGLSIAGRLIELGRLRKALDVAGVDRPIHVFGGLDPLLTPLYVRFGAEIVDGVGWLRYFYSDEDTALYLEARPILENDVDAEPLTRLFATFAKNLLYIRSMNTRLRHFARTPNWQAYSSNRGATLSGIADSVAAELEGEA